MSSSKCIAYLYTGTQGYRLANTRKAGTGLSYKLMNKRSTREGDALVEEGGGEGLR